MIQWKHRIFELVEGTLKRLFASTIQDNRFFGDDWVNQTSRMYQFIRTAGKRELSASRIQKKFIPVLDKSSVLSANGEPH